MMKVNAVAVWWEQMYFYTFYMKIVGKLIILQNWANLLNNRQWCCWKIKISTWSKDSWKIVFFTIIRIQTIFKMLYMVQFTILRHSIVLDGNSQTYKWIPNGLFTYITLSLTGTQFTNTNKLKLTFLLPYT